MLKAFREILWAAAPSAACGLALHFVFDFSTRQGVGISCILWFLILSIRSLAQNFNFKPYALRVEINLHILFTDFGLIDSPADWAPYREKAKAEGFNHEPFREGFDDEHFRIYALGPRLFATNVPYEPYMGTIYIRSRIEQISVPATHASKPNASRFSRFPEIRFEGRKYWFVLRLSVPEDWEQEIRARFPGADVDKEWDTGCVSVTVAAFPARYIQHVIEHYEPFNFLWKWRDRRFLKWFKASDWERDEESPDRWGSFLISHKYISVSFKVIS